MPHIANEIDEKEYLILSPTRPTPRRHGLETRHKNCTVLAFRFQAHYLGQTRTLSVTFT
jgi:hypothetical protein